MTGKTLTIRSPMAASFGGLLPREFVGNRLRRFFDDPFVTGFDMPLVNDVLSQPLGWSPVVEATETPAEFVMTVELPGMKREDITVECENDILTIRGTKAEEKKRSDNDRQYHLYERSYGEFQRSFSFPSTILADKVNAEMESGVLTVHVPKSPKAVSHARKIEIASKK